MNQRFKLYKVVLSGGYAYMVVYMKAESNTSAIEGCWQILGEAMEKFRIVEVEEIDFTDKKLFKDPKYHSNGQSNEH